METEEGVKREATDADGKSDDDCFRVPAFVPPPAKTKQDSAIPEEKQEQETAPNGSGPQIVDGSSSVVKPKEKPLLPVPYEAPSWAELAASGGGYSLDVLKNGVLIENRPLDAQRSFVTFGRLAQCDFHLEHPSISRFHAVLQFGKDPVNAAKGLGWHLYDLGSTHGTWRNKQQLPPKQYVRVHVGHVMKFGGSSRLYILSGPSDDEEQQSSKTLTELRKEKERRKLIADGVISGDADKQTDELDEEALEDAAVIDDGRRGISWGLKDGEGGKSDDDGGEDGEGEELNFETLQQREAYYRDDPKRVLMRFFAREGAELVYDCNEKGSTFNRQWHCRIELPVETTTGKTLWAEATVGGGSKKAAQVQAALEACRLLDVHGVLRHRRSDAAAKRKAAANRNLAENDYYDSDEDNFFDRTGELERKRQRRQLRVATTSSAATNEAEGGGAKVETYAGLLKKLQAGQEMLVGLERDLAALEQPSATTMMTEKIEPVSPATRKGVTAVDPLDEFMTDVRNNEGYVGELSQETKLRKSQLKLQASQCRKEIARLERLVKLAKPADLPTLDPQPKKKSIWVGSIKGQRLRKVEPIPLTIPPPVALDAAIRQEGLRDADVVEEENDEATSDDNDKLKPPTSIVTWVPVGETNNPKATDNNATTSSSVVDVKVYSVETAPSNNPPISPNKLENEETDQVAAAAADEEGDLTKADDETTLHRSKTKRPRVRHRRGDRGAVKPGDAADKFTAGYDASDPDFAVWLPPDDQRGDGRTSLNDKLGY